MSGDRKPWGVYQGDRLCSRHKTRAAADQAAAPYGFVCEVRRIPQGETYASARKPAARLEPRRFGDGAGVGLLAALTLFRRRR